MRLLEVLWACVRVLGAQVRGERDQRASERRRRNP